MSKEVIFTPSPLVKLPSQLSKSESALVDFSSLHALMSHWDRPGYREFDAFHDQNLSSGIEALVLHETVVCDSIFLEYNSGLRDFVHSQNAILAGVYLDQALDGETIHSIRSDAGARIEQTYLSLYELKPAGADDFSWNQLGRDDLHDKYALEGQCDFTPSNKEILVPPILDVDEYEKIKYLRNVPYFATRSGQALTRSLFYVELARTMQIPYSPSRPRAEVIRAACDMSWQSIAKVVLENAAKARNRAIHSVLKEVTGWACPPEHFEKSFHIPTLAERICALAVKERCTLGEAVLRFRESKNATLYRAAMANLTTMLSNPKKQSELHATLQKISDLTEVWSSDLGLKTNADRHTVTLKHIPYIGKLLESFGVDKWGIPVPARWFNSAIPGLLFLNESIRPLE